MVGAFFAILRRDLKLAFRAGGGAGLGLAFYLILALLVPLGVGPQPELLARLAPGMVWVGALLSALLTLDRMFQADVEDGTLDHLTLAPLPLEGAALAKAIAHWLTTGAPFILMAPLVGVMLRLPEEAQPTLMLSMALGGPALSLIGMIGAALTAGLKRGGLLTSLLVLPLYAPTLIFGALAVEAAASGAATGPMLMILGAISLGALALGPIVAAAALRLALE